MPVISISDSDIDMSVKSDMKSDMKSDNSDNRSRDALPILSEILKTLKRL